MENRSRARNRILTGPDNRLGHGRWDFDVDEILNVHRILRHRPIAIKSSFRWISPFFSRDIATAAYRISVASYGNHTTREQRAAPIGPL